MIIEMMTQEMALTILALAITATLMVILDFGMSMACKELAMAWQEMLMVSYELPMASLELPMTSQIISMMAKVMVSQMKEMNETRMVMDVWNESEVDKWINWKMNELVN